MFKANSLPHVKKSKKSLILDSIPSIPDSLSVELEFRIPIVNGLPDSLSCSPDSKGQAYSPFTWKNQIFWLENQMVRAISFGNLQKMWAVICSDAIFLLVLVCSADFYILCSGLFSLRHVKFYSFMFVPGILPGWFLCKR